MISSQVFEHQFAAIESVHVTAALERLRGRLADDAQGVGVYIHLPFCPTRCISCDHVALVPKSGKDIDRYLDLLGQELRQVSTQLGAAVPIQQLLVGGGSPNYLSDAQLARLADMLERHFAIAPGAEVSIEVNPKRCSRSQLELLRGLGFNSLRLELREIDAIRNFALGRSCTPELLQDVFSTARASGFEQLHLDYIYGLPGQSRESVREAADIIAELSPDRVLCHPFFRREQAFPHQQLIVSETMPSTAEKMGLFKAFVEGLEAGGFSWIGINGFVRTGDPLLAAQAAGGLYRGWLGYSAEEPPWLLGFGLGAISELPGLVTQNSAHLQEWTDRVGSQGCAAQFGAELSEVQLSERDAVSQLGANLRAPFGVPDRSTGSLIDELVAAGVVRCEGEQLIVTEIGRYELNERWEEAFVRQKPVNWFG